MSKKLVKTAKQQFEERLRGLRTIVEQVIDSNMHFYGCVDAALDFYVLYSYADKEFYECRYGRQFEGVMQSEEFLLAMVGRFDEGARKIRPLFEWYASADREINEAAPLDLRDVAIIGIEKEFITFEDLYEEVSDVRIITAKEQWEKDSSEAKTTLVIENVSYRIVLLETGIDVYIHEGKNEYIKESFPPLEELRKDVEFVTNYVSYISKNRSNFMSNALKWLRGGEYVMNEWGLMDIYSVCMGYCNTSYRYEDKEEPTEKPVAKNEFKDEMGALRTKMVAHIEQLCEQGLTLNVEVLCQNYTLTWADRSYVICEELIDCWIAKNDKGEWLFYREERDGEWDSALENFTVETLRNIIEALQ